MLSFACNIVTNSDRSARTHWQQCCECIIPISRRRSRSNNIASMETATLFHRCLRLAIRHENRSIVMPIRATLRSRSHSSSTSYFSPTPARNFSLSHMRRQPDDPSQVRAPTSSPPPTLNDAPTYRPSRKHAFCSSPIAHAAFRRYE